MLNFRTGKNFTRRDSIKGIAAILAAGCAPAIATAAARGAGGMARMRGAAAAAATVVRSARKYVQDGLILMWDGIENVGFDRHDSAATNWADLSGNGYDISLTGVTFADDHLAFAGTSGQGGIVNEHILPRTFEIVIRFLGSGNAFVLYDNGVNSNNTGLSFFASDNSLRFSNPFYSLGCDNTPTGIIKSISATASDIYFTLSSVLLNGTESLMSVSNGVFTDGEQRLILGRRTNDTYRFVGNIYCVRMYDTELTESQRLANYAVDKARFGLT